jgi:hypothetical protein
MDIRQWRKTALGRDAEQPYPELPKDKIAAM